MFVSNFFKFRNHINNAVPVDRSGSTTTEMFTVTDAKSNTNESIKIIQDFYYYNTDTSLTNNVARVWEKMKLNYGKILYAPIIKLSTTDTVSFDDYEIDNINSDIAISNLVYNSTFENNKTIITINCTVTNNGTDTEIKKAGIYNTVEYFNSFDNTVSKGYSPITQQMLIAEHVFDSPITLLANESKSLTIQLVLAS